MPEFSPNAAGRVARATRRVERSMRNDPPHRGRWFRGAADGVAFQLSENVGATTAGQASALRYQWDPSGDGAYTLTDETITVHDTLGIFSTGTSGSDGLARKKQAANGPVLEIWQLDC